MIGGRSALGSRLSAVSKRLRVHLHPLAARRSFHPIALPPCRFLLALLLAAPSVISAQTPDLEESRRRLDSIRVERQRLESESRRLESQVKDVGAELRNLEAQRRSTNHIVNEIDRQIGGLNTQVDRVGADLVLAQDNLAETRAILERRLIDISKRGALYVWQVLLSAESFGDLISRYKYLYLTNRQDQALLVDVEHLRDRVVARRDELLGLRSNLDRSRAERDDELARYTRLANSSTRQLRRLEQSGVRTERQLSQIDRDEAELNRQITALIEAARRGTVVGPGSITTADIGQLDWPVDGPIVFNFGRERQPDGVILRHNGIGIGAPVGTPVKVVADGTVVSIRRWGIFGLLILVDHGADHLSLYAQLDQAMVGVGDAVTEAQVIGTVGGANTEYGPHLHFEIRGAQAIALDPTAWLRERAN